MARRRGRYSLGVLGVLGVLCGGADTSPAPPQIYGFSTVAAVRQLAVERRYQLLPAPAKAEAVHAFLTAEPHVAGSPRDHLLAEWVRDRWKEYGLP